MNTKYIISLLFLVPVLLVRCHYLEEFERGNGVTVTERRTIEEFSEVNIGGNFEVLLMQGDGPLLSITTDENLLSFIETDVRDGVLTITQERKLFSKNEIELKVRYTHLEKVRVMGAAYLSNEDYLQEDELEIRMDGAGIIDLNVRCERLEVLLSGAGMVKLKGEVIEQDLNLTGAGKLEAYDLNSKVCSIVVGGLGSAEVYATDELNARLEGVGGIKYRGEPEILVTEINGLGKIRQADYE